MNQCEGWAMLFSGKLGHHLMDQCSGFSYYMLLCLEIRSAQQHALKLLWTWVLWSIATLDSTSIPYVDQSQPPLFFTWRNKSTNARKPQTHSIRWSAGKWGVGKVQKKKLSLSSPPPPPPPISLFHRGRVLHDWPAVCCKGPHMFPLLRWFFVALVDRVPKESWMH